ncbi:glycosyl hydrolase [Pontibacter rugosus]|uniref:Glycosyl hydrolase n=2 Tax=Pontibacter rugosus TaxID=1745966 RepID=A0ABW3SW29_9BACT
MLGYFIWQQNTTPPASASFQLQYEGPIVITKGGTYTGNWESKDAEVSAVEIKTSEPVIILNSNIRGAGRLIRSQGYAADIQVYNTYGYGITPTPWKEYKKPRNFLVVDVFRNIVVEHCYIENAAGINLGVSYEGNGSPQETVKIRYNKVRNIDGRVHDGWAIVNFVGLNFRNPIRHAEIAWNQVINEPDESVVEDNINIYNTRGLPDSPIRIHNNYIQGAFPLPSSESNYTGGGILSDSPGTDSTQATAHLEIYRNQLVGLGGYCIGIAGGNNIKVYNNRMVVAARHSNDSLYTFWTSGVWAKDYYQTKSTYANTMHHNTIAVVGKTGTWRNDIVDDSIIAANLFSNTVLADQVTKSMEKKEFEHWENKLRQNKIKIGPLASMKQKH